MFVLIERFDSPGLRMAKGRFTGFVALVGLGAAGLLAARAVEGPGGYLCLLGGGALLALGLPFLPAALRAWLGHLGEGRIDATLASLGDEYRLLCNFCPPGKVGDADRVLVGPHGVLVMEVKAYTRPARVRGEAWWVQLSGGKWQKIKSPADQVRGVASALGDSLGSPVSCVIVVSDGMSLDVTSSSVPIVRVRDLVGFVGEMRQTPVRLAG